MRGEPVGVEQLGGGRIDGRARAIAPDGALEVEIERGARAGETVRVMAGDVTLAKPAPDAR
jgi:biotin-(acetyl-CoA carboxylase) ligase